MNLIPTFLRNLFVPKTFAPTTPATTAVSRPTRKHQRQQSQAVGKRMYDTKYRWMRELLKDYDGSGSFVLRVPRDYDLDGTQAATAAYLNRRFGKYKFATRQFVSAHTIHINPK